MGRMLNVPDEILLRWGVRGHYILLAVALAPPVPFYFFPQLACGRLLVGYIANMTVPSTLVSKLEHDRGPGERYQRVVWAVLHGVVLS